MSIENIQNENVHCQVMSMKCVYEQIKSYDYHRGRKRGDAGASPPPPPKFLNRGQACCVAK